MPWKTKVVVLTGCSFNGVVSLYAGAGAGGSIGLGSGVLIMTGVSKVGNNAINGVAFFGGQIFVGSGTAVCLCVRCLSCLST